MNALPVIQYFGDREKAMTLKGHALAHYNRVLNSMGNTLTANRTDEVGDGIIINCIVNTDAYGKKTGRIRLFVPVGGGDDFKAMLTVMDVDVAEESLYPDPYTPPFQINNGRWLIESSLKQEHRSEIYSGGIQRREPEYEDVLYLNNEVPIPARPYSEGGSWRGKIGGKELAVSWSYLDPEQTDLRGAPTDIHGNESTQARDSERGDGNNANKPYCVYIGGKFGELDPYDIVYHSQYFGGEPWFAMPIAGISLIDPQSVGSNAKYVIGVLYRTIYRDAIEIYIGQSPVYAGHDIPYYVTYDVSNNGDDKLTFTKRTELPLSGLLSEPYDREGSRERRFFYSEIPRAGYRHFTGLLGDGKTFCVYYLHYDTLPTRYGTATDAKFYVEQVTINDTCNGYTSTEYHVPFADILFSIYNPPNPVIAIGEALGIVQEDHDRFCIIAGKIDYLSYSQVNIGELKDGVLTEVEHNLCAPLPLFAYGGMSFASTRLKIYQFYYIQSVEDRDITRYVNTLVTIVDGVKYTDSIYGSILEGAIMNWINEGQGAYQEQIDYISSVSNRWFNAAYTDELLILPSIDPYWYIGSPSTGKTMMIDFVTSTDDDGNVTVNGHKVSYTNKAIDSVYPPDLYEAAIVSPTSLIHLPY